MNLWLAIGLMGAGTYAIRLSMLVFVSHERLLAALIAGAMAWLVRNVWLTVGVGMGALWLLQWAG